VTTTAIQAQHARNVLRLARVNAALSAWDEYEANQRLPRSWASLHPAGNP